MIKLWHTLRDGDPYGGARNSNKIVIALDEIGEKCDLQAVRRMEDVRPQDAPYRKLNPNGVVPTIEEDGLVLWESGAILRYLADTRPGKGLLPQDAKARASADQWLTWEGATLAPALINLFMLMMAEQPDEQAMAGASAVYMGGLGILDQQLAGRDYVAGDFSAADIALGSLVPISFNVGLDLSGNGNIIAWLNRLRARPAFSGNEMFTADCEAGAAQLG